jgi:hypothetical protein
MATNIGLVTPKNATTMAVTSLLETVVNNKAYLESVKADPIFANKNLIKPLSVVDGQAVGSVDKFFMNITPKNTAARTVNLAFIQALTMSPIEGATKFLGNEGTLGMKFTQFFANDWAGGVTKEMFGIYAREMKNYNLNREVMRLLYQWRQEILGYYYREALVQRISHNLTAAPISLSQTYNKNWWVPSLSDASQPAYNATAASHATAIGAACGAAAMNAVLTPSYLLAFIDWLEGSYIEPVEIGGKQMYMMLTAPREIRRLRDPSVSGSFGDLIKGANADVSKTIPSADLVIADTLIMVRDPRIPTMTTSGGGSAWTLSFGYDKAGRGTSTKTSGVSVAGNNPYFYTNIVCGAGALGIYEPDKVHEEKQEDEYGQFEADALFGAIGAITPVWNVDSGSANTSTAQQESSVIVPTVKA